MFQGQYTVKVGDFFRIAFPNVYREKLVERIIVTYGFDQSLIVTSENNWDELYKKEIEEKSFLIPEVRDIKRFFLGGITYIEFDKQGRFILPEYLREHAQIRTNEEVTCVWQHEYIEIWNRKVWLEREIGVLKNISLIAEKLSRNEERDE